MTKVEVGRDGTKLRTYHQNPSGSVAWTHPYSDPVISDVDGVRPCPACAEVDR